MKSIYILIGSFISLIILTGCSTKGYSNYTWDKENMLKNPGFEIIKNNKIAYWESEGVVRSTDPRANSGKYYLMSSTNKEKAITSQVIDVNAYQENIDKGNVIASFGGFQSGWKKQKDYGYSVLVFYDDKPSKISHTSTQPFYSNHWWTKRANVVAVPEETRFIKYGFMGIRKEGTNNDAYLDDAFLYLGQKKVNIKNDEATLKSKEKVKEESYFDEALDFLSEKISLKNK
ncbi:MAG: hypothetical protein CL624_14230 [Arcobacter sp.]|uniref:Lipoprotein n=1 Tax=Poseidonibacter parvus TaxID=1850254 RepID=A0A1P8KQJ1_9BACT|nr:hypothetical protein [Poseidonibacter parvus]APW66798.1 hypothetical protein LPB137_13475 [Poseidonibacter parvus]MAC85284.1 hypothetical protein [Arcobacter sp.]|tara:strand:+ start:6850 stop:7542 length:693 start_codon:yes stop_codon:yes gene_type:complete